MLRLRCLESIQEDLNDWGVRGLTLKNVYPPPLSNATGVVWCGVVWYAERNYLENE